MHAEYEEAFWYKVTWKVEDNIRLYPKETADV
jgi:hypothetical protein